MSSTVVTNLVGPVQQMSLANHPVKGLYFTLAGGPEVSWIVLHLVSLRVTALTNPQVQYDYTNDKTFID